MREQRLHGRQKRKRRPECRRAYGWPANQCLEDRAIFFEITIMTKDIKVYFNRMIAIGRYHIDMCVDVFCNIGMHQFRRNISWNIANASFSCADPAF